METAIEILSQALNTCETNEPINREAGKIEQADLEKANASELRLAITVLRAASPAGTMQQQAIAEKGSLDVKLAKLEAFIGLGAGAQFSALPVDERSRLIAQRNVMREYSTILRQRIESFA